MVKSFVENISDEMNRHHNKHQQRKITDIIAREIQKQKEEMEELKNRLADIEESNG